MINKNECIFQCMNIKYFDNFFMNIYKKFMYVYLEIVNFNLSVFFKNQKLVFSCLILCVLYFQIYENYYYV